jgi:amino acid transporter
VFRRVNARGVPWVSIVACSVAWAAATELGFERLIELDVSIAGLSLVLEFAALVVLRRREPDLARPFRVPGGFAGAVLVGIPPTVLVALAVWNGRTEHVQILGHDVSALVAGLVLMALGPLAYAATGAGRRGERA